jgi:hypothetical protein
MIPTIEPTSTTMVATVEPTSTEPGPALTVAASSNPVDTRASTEVEEDEAGQTEGAHRMFVLFRMFRILLSLLESSILLSLLESSIFRITYFFGCILPLLPLIFSLP